ncbi:proton-coupled zinc antiporter SLC30A2 isoform X2 [Bemisia tabaci]|uniref:proton-coupled zinc antiporter SLC30A2 isoform X2 n=1 Tax=Bemisia tabaci TaxID=7038 RepID=UPI0008F9AF32|nr:PREDICTED: zinc transporter 2-like isoform X2 [Bemisia tabaci]XP_018912389.1 PREDICTED: zinc transporter 2-like isoform X2 [Bemisia tabaci]XP_018912391.1 PREDICTED: zinc transporter 2-like isoform X2 [Bemisia tabaci]XP_018912392.1 PREDICTED: zinc transporter 2-like isoform X2 [Bemisia tabaci]
MFPKKESEKGYLVLRSVDEKTSLKNSDTIVYGAALQSDNVSNGKDNGSITSSTTHRVIYCVHGKASGCCPSLTGAPSKNGSMPPDGGPASPLPSDTITIYDEHYCHNEERTTTNTKARKKLIIASILCIIFMIGEIIGGYLSSSLAIATDAAHLLTDFASFMISLFALWVANRPPTQSMPFGWYRAEVIGALTSVLMIWIVTGILVYMAVERIIKKDFEIDAKIMLITSAVGVLVNIIMAFSLHQHGHSHGGKTHTSTGDSEEESHHSHRDNINVRAAFIHVIGDFIQSFGVLLAALVIYFKPEWSLVDPICTFLFSVLVLITTFAIIRDTLVVLMEGIPSGVNFADVLNTFLSIEGVMKVHNLRIWALSLDKTALSAHLAVRPGCDSAQILKCASRKIHNKFHFFEITLQIEEFHEQMENCAQCQPPLK